MRWLSVLVLALALVAAGCGGSDDDSSASDTTTVEETTTEDTTTAETTIEESTDDGTDTGAFDFADEDCQSLVQAYVGLSAAIAAASSGQDVSGDIEGFAEYVDKVPEEIRADVETIAAAYGTFVDDLEGLGYTPGEVPTADQLQALQGASASLGTPEVQAAGERLSAWTTENCG
jgi:hypothetical protein